MGREKKELAEACAWRSVQSDLCVKVCLYMPDKEMLLRQVETVLKRWQDREKDE